MLSQYSIEENSIEENRVEERENKKNGTKRFVPPSLEEIQAYVEEKNLNVDAKQFYEYFDTGNWIDAKGQKVKNWKQKMLTWNKHEPRSREQQKDEQKEDRWARFMASNPSEGDIDDTR